MTESERPQKTEGERRANPSGKQAGEYGDGDGDGSGGRNEETLVGERVNSYDGRRFVTGHGSR